MCATNQTPLNACPQPAAPQTTPKSQGDLSPRGRKNFFLPQIVQLALEGHPSQAISKKLGVPRRTVDRWLQEQRQNWAAQAKESAAEMFAVTVARLEAAYREAMQAWRSSLADKQVRLEALADTAADADAKPKGSVRTETQSGQPALLGRAVQAAIAICEFKAKHRNAQQRIQRRDVFDLADDLENLENGELYDLQGLLRAGNDDARKLIAEKIRERNAK